MTTSARPAVSLQIRSMSARAIDWPVGLFGEQTKTIFVVASIAFRMLSVSNAKSALARNGTRTMPAFWIVA